MAHQLRFQRKRTKGWKMPEGGICCTRPGPWGNPFATADEFRTLIEAIVGISGQSEFHAVDLRQFAAVNWQAQHIHELRGRPLGCYCRLDQPCHVDVLCEIANRKEPDGH